MNRTDAVPSERRPRRRPGENRERLIDAGIIVFGDLGFHGASTAAIGTLAGVPQPHVYANFRTKRELFLACSSRVEQQLLQGQSPPVIVSDQLARFVLQLVASVRDSALRDDLQPISRQISAELGQPRFSALLLRAAESLCSET